MFFVSVTPRYLCLLPLFLLSCAPRLETIKGYQSADLRIRKVSEHVYQHTSFLATKDFGDVLCNGLIVFDRDEAVIFDTPSTDTVSLELIDWVQANLAGRIKAVVPTHFHADCLGGLPAFHARGIPSYASAATVALAQENHFAVPQNTFRQLLPLRVGGTKVVAEFVGAGHTRDNIVAYVPADRVLFGGCLVKELGAARGNLADADTAAWPATVAAVQRAFPAARVVVPGHGKLGGPELLDYTRRLFSQGK